MKTLAELGAVRDRARAAIGMQGDNPDKIRVLVGMATCGIAAGARPVLAALADETARKGLSNVSVTQTGCIGMCQYEPMVEVVVPGRENVAYVNMTPDKAIRVVHEHIIGGKVVSEYTVGAVIN
ncbi:MAG: (2Fe-2S) ferredoxin domain-containing protein [Oscillospiraceae bacterium]|nr:(2Fe-2S) ferredoxin domain-containing protein [Oscillospiraceae bacterium]